MNVKAKNKYPTRMPTIRPSRNLSSFFISHSSLAIFLCVDALRLCLSSRQSIVRHRQLYLVFSSPCLLLPLQIVLKYLPESLWYTGVPDDTSYDMSLKCVFIHLSFLFLYYRSYLNLAKHFLHFSSSGIFNPLNKSLCEYEDPLQRLGLVVSPPFQTRPS